MQQNPNANPADIAKIAKADVNYVYMIRYALNRKKRETVSSKTSGVNIDSVHKKMQPAVQPKNDPVNHPAHYKVGGVETIDFIEAKGLNYHLGNVVKYVTRADHKGERLENLKKARWYLEREISHAENSAGV